MTRQELLIDADFTEDAVALAIESFLSMVSFPFMRFSLLPFSRSKERWLGADARLQGSKFRFRPLYMQFKRPSAYSDQSKSRIIKDRKNVTPAPLQTAPRTLFFNLRKKQKDHEDFQHNILFRLRQRLNRRNLGDAVYVCPLFLDRSAYRFHVHIAALKQWPFFWRHPYDWNELLLDDSGHTVRFDRIPVLSEHICIPPHTSVLDAKHSYSFTEAGTQVCFHSPESVNEGCVPLSKWLTIIVDKPSEDAYLNTNTARDALRSVVLGEERDEPLPHAKDILESKDGIQSWLSWGHFLRETYGIQQFALARWEDSV
jgi:hypothetical protein